MKLCTKCKIEKSASNFYKDSSKKDNLASNCKECKKANAKPQPYVPGRSLYRNLSPETVARERIRKKKYRKEHPEVVAATNRRTYVKRKAVSIECTSYEVRMFMQNNTHCLQCESTEDLTLDHIIPISWGILSRHALDNFQVLCNPCNSSKSNDWSIDFRCDDSLSEVNLLFLC